MIDQTDTCPLNMNGDHHYFVFKTVETFVPYKFKAEVEAALADHAQLYQKKEYAILGCNCGSAIKSEVKQQ